MLRLLKSASQAHHTMYSIRNMLRMIWRQPQHVAQPLPMTIHTFYPRSNEP